MKSQREVFDNWISQYKGLLIKIIRSFCNEPEDFDDLFQEISIQLWSSIPNFKGDSKEITWIYRVSLNTAIKWSKKSRKYTANLSDLEINDRILIEKEEKEDDRVKWLYDKISQFNEVDKSLIVLLLDGFTYKEIADMTGIEPSHVGVKIHRIKKNLINDSKKYDDYAV